ncbi:MAG: hypothetical protein K0Q79_3279 [Flavipsychrobacter sp.]|jgi:hypothetical protein|nr:hypothetical protein [Flavipsychrobacter sp.]
MKNILLVACVLLSVVCYSQERYIGLTRDSITTFHAKYFDQVYSNDTALLVKHKNGLDWRYFRFEQGVCTICAKEVLFYNDFINLEKKLKSQKFKDMGETVYDFAVSKVKGTIYTKGKENYILMYKPINPNLSATTRAVVYYKMK